MKTYIHKINQYLLEHHPTVWNTKIVWMLGISAAIHLLFFVFGLIALTDPELLHERGAMHIFFDNGTVFFSVMLSILLIVIWLINMFKNNAFKNFYPVSRLKLFIQFVFYFVIIFCATTFYYSYNLGLKVYISNTYEDATVYNEIKVSNNAAIFFSHNIEKYTLNKRKYPFILSELYCETRDGFTKTEKPYFEFLDLKYQYYSLYTKERKISETYNENFYNGYVYKRRTDSIETFYYRDTVVDVSQYVKTAIPSYYNYSSTFYSLENDEISGYDSVDYNYESDLNYDYNYDFYYDTDNINKSKLSNKNVHEILNRNNPKEIKQILTDFLKIADIYKIKYNMSSEQWFDLVYHPQDFEIKHLINDEPREDYRLAIKEETELEKFVNEHTSHFYIETDKLHHAFENIEDIKDADIFGESIHVFIWLSFFLAITIFMFRVTGLKSLLFTIITVGVLTIFVSLLTTLFAFASKPSSGDSVGFFIMYFTLILGTIILAIPLFFASNLKKQIVSICLNISLSGFVLYIFLIIGIISLHQENYCRDHFGYDYRYNDCFILMSSIGFYLSYVLLAIGLLFMYFYTGIIKKWKALAEG